MERSEIASGLWKLRDEEFAFLISYLASRGIDLERSPAEALGVCVASAISGDSEGQFALAKLLWTGLAGPRDDRQAFQWCARASEQGYLPAHTMLAGFYASGIGVNRDEEKSIQLLEAAVAAGSPRAALLLGTVHYYGSDLTAIDTNRAIALWTIAANQDYADAQCTLGSELILSSDTKVKAEGIEWLKRAAAQQQLSAHYALASLYESGTGGLPKDMTLARHHLDIALSLGGGEDGDS